MSYIGGIKMETRFLEKVVNFYKNEVARFNDLGKYLTDVIFWTVVLIAVLILEKVAALVLVLFAFMFSSFLFPAIALFLVAIPAGIANLILIWFQIKLFIKALELLNEFRKQLRTPKTEIIVNEDEETKSKEA